MNCIAALLQVRGRARGALSLCGWEVWAGYRAKSSCPVVTVGPRLSASLPGVLVWPKGGWRPACPLRHLWLTLSCLMEAEGLGLDFLFVGSECLSGGKEMLSVGAPLCRCPVNGEHNADKRGPVLALRAGDGERGERDSSI